MERELKQYRVLQTFFIIMAVVGILLLYPGRFFGEKITNAMRTDSYQATEVLAEDRNVMQEMIPSQEYLHSITVMVDSLGGSTGLFKLHLYDQSLNLLWEDGRRFDESPGIAEYTFHVDQKVVVGQPYYYTLDYDSASFVACYTDKNTQLQGDNGTLYYNLQEIPNGALITSYEYKISLSPKKIIVYDAAILFAALLLCFAVAALGRRGRLRRNMTKSQILHLYAGTILAAGTVYAIWQVAVNHMFSMNRTENMVLSAGIMLAAIIAMYGIFEIQIDCIKIDQKTIIRKMPDILQVIFWGMAVQACCDFVNAGSNYAQGLALREMCIYFGLAVITMFTKKELWNKVIAVYLVLAVGAAFFYSNMFWGQGEPFQTAVRTAVMCLVAGVVIIVTGYHLIQKKIAFFSLPFAAMTGAFFVLLILFRNGNIWEIAIVVPFTLFYIRQQSMEQIDKMLGNIANGVVLSFLITTVQALLYRPFHYYTMTRYSGIFMTVTVTAVYLSMIFAVALCKLLIKYQQSHTLRSVWKELVVMGLACGYEFLTLSRTGMASCLVVYFVTCGLYVVFHFREHLQPFRFIFYTLLAIICCIPIAYTGSRIIPALSDRPKIYLGEEFQDSIKQGEPIDSFRYITIEKLLGMSRERMLGKTDLSYVTQSGKTVQEVLEEAKEQDKDTAMEESGVTVNDDKVTYIDDYGSEYTIDNPDYSNGRLDIFKIYLKNLNLTGHSAIGLPQEDGSIIVHAHNSFIQMAYDCGVVTGVVFLLCYIILGFRSIWYYQKRKDVDRYAMLPVIIFATFGISSMVEYVFRPTIPLGFVFLLMIAPLIIRPDKCDAQQAGAELEQK